MTPAVEPLRAFRRLLKAYGPQHWWPSSGDTLLDSKDLEVCLGAILTQNTNWLNVEKALKNLHKSNIKNLKDFLRIDQRNLERLIRSSGYFRQKARKVKEFVRHLDRRGGRVGKWLSGDLKARRRELLDIHGIGPETADSILLYAAQRPAFVVDAYTLRIGSRLGWWRTATYDRAQAFLVKKLPKRVPVYNEFHALLVTLAKRRCRKDPLCAGCPLQDVCRFGSLNHEKKN